MYFFYILPVLEVVTEAFNVSAFGGAGTYSFLWSDGGTSKDRTGLTAGNYTLTITDIAGCTAVYLYELNNPNPITVQLNKTDPSCINSGVITLNVTGGNIPLTYDWQDLPGAFNNKDRSGLTPGNYNVTVTDDKGCTGAASITLNSPNCDSTAIDVCKSVVSDRYSVVNDPNVTSYNWTVPAGAVIVSGQGTSSIIVDWSGASPGFDQVCVSAENSCKESDEICVLIYIKEVTAAAAVAPPVCIGSNLLLLGSGGVSYNWSGPHPLHQI
jgi:large repetitive protein